MQQKAECICSEIQREIKQKKVKILRCCHKICQLGFSSVPCIVYVSFVTLFFCHQYRFLLILECSKQFDAIFKFIPTQILLSVNYGVCWSKCSFFYCKSCVVVSPAHNAFLAQKLQRRRKHLTLLYFTL